MTWKVGAISWLVAVLVVILVIAMGKRITLNVDRGPALKEEAISSFRKRVNSSCDKFDAVITTNVEGTITVFLQPLCKDLASEYAVTFLRDGTVRITALP